MSETVATYSVPEHHAKMYTGNVRAALNKKGGIVYPLVSQGSYKGEKIQLIDFLGPVQFTKRDTVYQDTQLVEVEHTSRWITGSEYDCAILIDRLDTLKMIYEPTSPYVERMREAAARKQDQIVVDKFFATAKSGKEGTTDSPFGPTSPTSVIIPDGSTGLTVAKLRLLRKTMKKFHVDLRGVKPTILVTSEQTDNLLAETVVGSYDYNVVKPLVDGEVGTFMGFNFVPYEDYNGEGLPTDTTSGVVRLNPVFTPDGMHFGQWDGLTITINNRPDKNNIKQAHATFTAGATRIEEGRVFQVRNKES